MLKAKNEIIIIIFEGRYYALRFCLKSLDQYNTK